MRMSRAEIGSEDIEEQLEEEDSDYEVDEEESEQSISENNGSKEDDDGDEDEDEHGKKSNLEDLIANRLQTEDANEKIEKVPRKKRASSKKYKDEDLYKMVSLVLKHPSAKHSGQVFWSLMMLNFGNSILEGRNITGLRNKWKKIARMHTTPSALEDYKKQLANSLPPDIIKSIDDKITEVIDSNPPIQFKNRNARAKKREPKVKGIRMPKAPRAPKLPKTARAPRKKKKFDLTLVQNVDSNNPFLNQNIFGSSNLPNLGSTNNALAIPTMNFSQSSIPINEFNGPLIPDPPPTLQSVISQPVTSQPAFLQPASLQPAFSQPPSLQSGPLPPTFLQPPSLQSGSLPSGSSQIPSLQTASLQPPSVSLTGSSIPSLFGTLTSQQLFSTTIFPLPKPAQLEDNIFPLPKPAQLEDNKFQLNLNVTSLFGSGISKKASSPPSKNISKRELLDFESVISKDKVQLSSLETYRGLYIAANVSMGRNLVIVRDMKDDNLEVRQINELNEEGIEESEKTKPKYDDLYDWEKYVDKLSLEGHIKKQKLEDIILNLQKPSVLAASTIDFPFSDIVQRFSVDKLSKEQRAKSYKIT